MLAPALVDVDLGAAERRGEQLRPSPAPAGTRWSTARRRPARRSRPAGRPGARTGGGRGRTARRTCAARRSSGPRWPATRRGAPAPAGSAAPPRTSIAGHRTDRTFRSESRPRPMRPRRVGAVAPGPRPIHRFTVRSRDADPRAAAIAAGASSLGHRRSTAPSTSPTWCSSRATSTTPTADRLGAFLADPLLQTGSWDVARRDGHRDHAAPRRDRRRRRRRRPRRRPARRRRARRRHRPAHRVPAGTGRPTPTSCCGGSSPTRSSSTGRDGPADPDLHPGSDDAPGVETIAVRGLDDDGLARARRRAVAGPRPRGAGRHPRPLHGRSGATRPTSSWRRWPRRGASTAPTRRSGPRSRPTTATTLPSLLGQLRDATDAVAAPFVRSAFVGNAGIVSFAPARRSPSRPRPTTTRRPSSRSAAPTPASAASSATCWAPPTARSPSPTCCASARPTCPLDELPDGALHPRRIRDGVIDGVADYGNKIGLPTVAGAVLYDPGVHHEPARVLRLHRRRRRPAAARPARSPATASSCSAGAPGATASAARRSPAPRWTPPPARSPGPACRSATRSPRSC